MRPVLKQKYSWCHVPEIASVGFFLGEKACRAVCFALQQLYFCSSRFSPGTLFFGDEHRQAEGCCFVEFCCLRDGVAIALQLLQVGPDVGRALIAKVSILLEGFGDDTFELGGQRRIQACGRNWRGVEYRFENDGLSVAPEWGSACAHFIQHRTEGEEVGARIDVIPIDLLG